MKYDGNGEELIVEPSSATYDMSVGKTHADPTIESDGSKKVEYTLNVTTNRGTDPDQTITVSDNFTQTTAIGEYDQGSFKIYKVVTDKDGNETKTDITSSYQPSFNTNGDNSSFNISGLPALEKGESYRVVYDIKNIKPKEGASADGSSSLDNFVKATSGDQKPETSDSVEVSKSLIAKSGWYDTTTRKVTWNITLNQDGNNLKGFTFIDTPDTNLDLSKLDKDDKGTYITLVGKSGKKIKVYFKDGKFSHKFEDDDTDTYTASYSTGVINDADTVSNKAEIDGKTVQSQVDVPEPAWNVEKQFKSDLAGDDEDHRVYTWDTSVDIPNGITKDGFVITDEIRLFCSLGG